MLSPNDLSDYGSPVGYLALIQGYQLKVLPLVRVSLIAHRGGRKVFSQDGVEIHLYPKGYAPQEATLRTHLEFALKHEGIELGVLAALFAKVPKEAWEALAREAPTGRYTRMIWYLYEWQTASRLDLPDAQGGSYVTLLDPERFYTTTPFSSPRHRIHNNLLGNPQFCPVVRRLSLLEEYEAMRLEEKGRSALSRYSDSVIRRASHYLFIKETLSSYEIEREQPNRERAARFTDLLKHADGRLQLDITRLIRLQNAIVDPRFADSNLRTFQNYIGEEIFPLEQKVHYIPPKPGQVASLMEGLLQSLDRMLESHVHPVVIAATIAFGFVYIHPFEDGNGRLHRFLIHHVLAKTHFSPPGALFPVSAVMLRMPEAYDRVLETVSEPLMRLITDYTLTSQGALTVNEETDLYYRYIDYTPMAIFLFECIQMTIETDFEEELQYLDRHDKLKAAILHVVDLPQRKLELLIQCLLQNGGKLAGRKRQRHFPMLTDQEVRALEQVAEAILS